MRQMAFAALALLLCSGAASGTPHGPSPRPTLENLLTIYQLGGLRNGVFVSPDGQSVALFQTQARLASNDYHTDLVLMDRRTGQAHIAADAGGWIQFAGRPSGAQLDRIAVWSPDGRAILFNAERGGRVELWRLDVVSGASEMVARGPGDVVDFAFADHGRAILYRTGPEWRRLGAEHDRRDAIGFHVDDAFSADFALRPLENRLLPQDAWRMEAATAQIRPATPTEISGLAASPSPLGVLVSPLNPNDHADDPEMAVFSRPSDPASVCHDARCHGEVKQAWALPNGDIVFLRMEDPAASYTTLYRWRPSTGGVRLLRRAEDKLFDCQRGALGLVCLQEAIEQPRRLVTIDIDNGAMGPLYDPNPNWSRFMFARYERIDVNDAYGNQAFAHLLYPDDYVSGRRYPLVIVQYRSRGFLRGGVGDEYPIQELARRGFFVLSVDRPEPRALSRRLSARDLERQTEIDQSERIMKMSALDTLIDNVVHRGLVDASRVGITGLSDGAETVYWAITHSRRFAAAIASTPPIDPVTWFAGSEQFRAGRRREFGFPGPWSDVHSDWDTWWRDTPPVNRATEIRTPLMMQLADAEALPALGLYARLREDNRPVEFYLYPNEFHLKWQPRHLLVVQERALAWMDFWLRDVEDADPTEPDRVTRWRELRTTQAALAAEAASASPSTR